MRMITKLSTGLLTAGFALSSYTRAAEPVSLACRVRLQAASTAPPSRRAQLMAAYYKSCGGAGKPAQNAKPANRSSPEAKPVILRSTSPPKAAGKRDTPPPHGRASAQPGIARHGRRSSRRGMAGSPVRGCCGVAAAPVEPDVLNYEPSQATEYLAHPPTDNPNTSYPPRSPNSSNNPWCSHAALKELPYKASEIADLYPTRAIRDNVAGRALVRCRVNIRGEFSECAVSNEEPKGYGFGDAALQIFKIRFSATPALCAGPGRVDRATYDNLTIVQSNIRFKLPE